MAPPPKLNIQPKLDISDLTLDQLIQAAKEILKPKQNLANLDSVVNLPRITIRERIQTILALIKNDQKSSFKFLLGNKYSRIEIVVTFLALLELVKRHILVANQESLFGNIELAHQENNEFSSDDEIEFEE